MTKQTTFAGPAVSAVTLFQRIAPTFASEIAAQMYRAGLRNSDDLICALTTGLRSFARDQDVCLASDFPKAWPEALGSLRSVHSEQEWEEFLAQSTSAPGAWGVPDDQNPRRGTTDRRDEPARRGGTRQLDHDGDHHRPFRAGRCRSQS